MMGIEPAIANQNGSASAVPEEHTHGHSNAEQPAHNLVNICVKLLVASLCAVHGPVYILAHSEAEKIGLADDEIQVLIKHLGNAL